MTVNRPIVCCFILLFIFFTEGIKAQHVRILQQKKSVSIRGLSVVDDSVAWISGSKGYISRTTNGGKNWAWQQVKGFENADFRDIDAFSDKEAIIMSSGTPALILKTVDGGLSWQLKYRSNDTTYFFDAMGFADARHGFILGDPINGKFLLMETKNDGETWELYKNLPLALPGEAAFAASGTCMRVDTNSIFIVTGGSYSRRLMLLLGSVNEDNKWLAGNLPILHGRQSQGAFSFANGNSTGIFVGGDYAADKHFDAAACYINYSCNCFNYPTMPISGYQSCVEYIGGDTFISTGTPGTNITFDGGRSWRIIDDKSFNVCGKAKHGTLVLLAGNEGKIAILEQ